MKLNDTQVCILEHPNDRTSQIAAQRDLEDATVIRNARVLVKAGLLESWCNPRRVTQAGYAALKEHHIGLRNKRKDEARAVLQRDLRERKIHDVREVEHGFTWVNSCGGRGYLDWTRMVPA